MLEISKIITDQFFCMTNEGQLQSLEDLEFNGRQQSLAAMWPKVNISRPLSLIFCIWKTGE